MDFKQITYIIKVAECRNITKAARELYISQPSLSQLISKAEEELGIRIFDRNTNPLTLTYAGKRYIEEAKKIIDINENIKKELQDIAGCQKGLIVFGIPRERGSYMLPPLIKRFRERYPEVDIQIVEENTDLLLEHLKKGHLDLIFIPERKQDEELSYEKIYEEELFLAVGNGVLDRTKCLDGYSDVIDWEKIQDLPFVVLKQGHGSRKTCEEIFARYGFSPRILLETSSNLTALRMAEEGVAAAIVPEMTIRLFQGSRRFNTYSLDKEPVTWNVLAVYRKNAYQNAAQKSMIEMAREIFEKRTKYNYSS